VAKCKTYINGFFFEYDCQEATQEMTVEGLQYRVLSDLEEEPVTVGFLKEHIRVDFDTDDNLLPAYLKAARQELEKYSQLSFGEKTIKLMALKLYDKYRLMYGPVTAITAPANTYTLFGDIVKDAGGEDVEITYTTGWDNSGGLPEDIRIAICRMATGLYINRENVLTEISGKALINEAKKTLDGYKNSFLV